MGKYLGNKEDVYPIKTLRLIAPLVVSGGLQPVQLLKWLTIIKRTVGSMVRVS